MLSLFFRNLFFTLLQPGIVAGLIPFWILGDRAGEMFGGPWGFSQYVGIMILGTGLIILFACIISFAVWGRGTLSPADPTKKLVVEGLYKFSRNPMYVGVALILLGETIFFQSFSLGIYSLLVFIVFNIFIRYFEEPRLRRDFKEDYQEYCREVRRWI